MKVGNTIYIEIKTVDEEIKVYEESLERLKVNDLNEYVVNNVAIDALKKELKLARDKRNQLANTKYEEVK